LEGKGSKDTTTRTTSDNPTPVKVAEEGSQGNKQQGTFKEDTLVAFRTRIQQQAAPKRIPKRIDNSKGSRNNKTSLMK
jgi:hypothetical protein